MGDSRRFWTFAELITKHLDPKMHIADIAGGKGQLRAALFRHHFPYVVTWDKRKTQAKGRRGDVYGWFDWKTAPKSYDAVIGMHPDEATDHILCYAIQYRVPALICPCCIMPSALPYDGIRKWWKWNDHLRRIAEKGNMKTQWVQLPIEGSNRVLICQPK